MIKRTFLIVLDSFGIGEAPDADHFCDSGANTYKSVSKAPSYRVNSMNLLGLSKISNPTDDSLSLGAYGKCIEKSMGKDTVIGHWEIAGVISNRPFPTFPDGFPQSVIDRFQTETGKHVLCNRPYSGTDVIRDFGKEHMESGALIVYTSADSVFQIAAHEDVVPIEELYRYCKIARNILKGPYAVGRVIARPFGGKYPDFYRLPFRHDYSVSPRQKTLLDALKQAGKDVIGIGKISDIFAGSGITESYTTIDNFDGMNKTYQMAGRDFNGLCFTNLVDFDAKYGHRRDVDGYAAAISSFDEWLSSFMKIMTKEDLLIITADHGCDPAFVGTDHTREFVPLLVYNSKIKPINLHVRSSFADIGATIADIMGVSFDTEGESFKPLIF